MKRKNLVFIVVVLFFFFSVSACFAQAAKADSSKTPEEIEWEKLGADCLKIAPTEVINGTDVVKAKYIMNKVGNQLNKKSVIPNTSYVDRVVLGGESGSCGDVSNKLTYALNGAGIKNSYLFGEKSMSTWSKAWRNISDPLDVNPDHGGVVIYEDGKAYVFDLWIQGAINKTFYNTAGGDWNGMDIKEWESKLKSAGYVTFSTLSQDNAYGGTKYGSTIEAIKNFVKNQLPKIPEEIRLNGDTAWEGVFMAEKTLQLEGRIVYSKPAGGNWTMEVLVNGKNVTSSLLNKGQSFKYKDGRTYSYLNGASWMLFYSPNFSANNSTAGGGYQVLTNPGQACRYKWNISSLGQDFVTIKVRIVNNGSALGKQIVIRNLSTQ